MLTHAELQALAVDVVGEVLDPRWKVVRVDDELAAAVPRSGEVPSVHVDVPSRRKRTHARPVGGWVGFWSYDGKGRWPE